MNLLSRLRVIGANARVVAWKQQIRGKSSLRKFFQKPSEEKFRAIDDLPQTYTLIYRNVLERYLLLAQLASGLSFVTVTGMILYKQDSLSEAKINFGVWEKTPKPIQNEMVIYVTALMVFAVGLQLAVSKMPLRIYKCREKYVFIGYSNIPLGTKKFVEASKNIKKLPPDGIVPWKNSLYQVGNRSGIVLVENYFRTPSELNEMLGEGYYKCD